MAVQCLASVLSVRSWPNTKSSLEHKLGADKAPAPILWLSLDPHRSQGTETAKAGRWLSDQEVLSLVCGFAVFADSVLRLTLTSDHPSNVVNKFQFHVLTNASLIVGRMPLTSLQISKFVFLSTWSEGCCNAWQVQVLHQEMWDALAVRCYWMLHP